jgi:hypothetical protein
MLTFYTGEGGDEKTFDTTGMQSIGEVVLKATELGGIKGVMRDQVPMYTLTYRTKKFDFMILERDLLTRK